MLTVDIRSIISMALIAVGVLLMMIETFGIFKIKHSISRLHSAAIGDSSAILLIVLGAAVSYGNLMVSIKSIALLAMFWLASPVCAHLVIHLEANTNEKLEKECDIAELEDIPQLKRKKRDGKGGSK